MKKKILCKRLQELGWWKYGEGGSHEKWTNGEQKTVVPRHAEINEYTAEAIVKNAQANPQQKGALMKIEGKLIRSGRWWAVEIPLLKIFTQGKSRSNAYSMAKDAIEALIDEERFTATITEGPADTFTVGSSNDTLLMALALKQQRSSRHLSVRDVAKNLGSNSPAAYSRYEQGKVKPSLDKFSQLLKAIDQRLEPVLTIV